MKRVSLLSIVLFLFLLTTGAAWSDDNYDCATATPISLDSSGSATVDVEIEAADDVDYLQISVPAAGGLTVEGDWANLEASVKAGNACSDVESYPSDRYGYVAVAHLSPESTPGTYYVAVSGAPGTYRLIIAFEQDDHGDSFADATKVELDTSGTATVQGRSDSFTDDDYFSLDLDTLGILNVSDDYFSGTLLFSLLAADGTLLDSGDSDIAINRRMDAGTYFLNVNDYDNAIYSLNVAFDNQIGALKVIIEPVEAQYAGARWRVEDGEGWHKSGESEWLAPGSYFLIFRSKENGVEGWEAPEKRAVTIVAGEIREETGAYVSLAGSLTVTIAPPEAVAAGAQWRVDTGPWKNSGDAQSGLTDGEHTLEFSSVSGWITPPNQTITIAGGAAMTASGTYSLANPQQKGAISVTIGPAQAVAAGAQWRVDGGAWRNSGDKVEDLTVGAYTVDYKAVPGWIAPAAQTASVAQNQTTPLTGTYVVETQDTTPPRIVEMLPRNGAGIDNETRVPSAASFAVRLADDAGIDVTRPDAVVFDIYYQDADNLRIWDYSRGSMTDREVRIVKLSTSDGNDSVKELWAVYDKAREIAVDGGNSYPFDTEVSITVTAADKLGNTVVSDVLIFKTETEAQHDHAADPANLPETTATTEANRTTIEVLSGNLAGVKLIYSSNEPIKPRFGPEYDEVPALDVAVGVGWPLNLQPSTVFNRPVTVVIPVVGYPDVDGLSIYHHDGVQWKLACDGAGNVQAGGEGWVVPGSRTNLNFSDDPATNDPSRIELQVYHFSGLQAGANTPGTGSLTITITPPEAVADGAQWRVDGGPWRDSGYTEADLSVGSHNVEFSKTLGWTTPAAQAVTVNEGQTAMLTGTYTEDPGQNPEGNSSGGGGGGGGCFIGSLLVGF